jgi:hypothetical protein
MTHPASPGCIATCMQLALTTDRVVRILMCCCSRFIVQYTCWAAHLHSSNVCAADHVCLRSATARFRRACRILTSIRFDAALQHQSVTMTSVSTAAARRHADDAAPSEALLQHSDLAQLNGHATRCVGAMLSAMVGDVLGEPRTACLSDCASDMHFAPFGMSALHISHSVSYFCS